MLSPVHLHLLLNHIPVIGLGFALLVFVYALLRKSGELTTAALGLLVLTALVAIPVYLTGEPAEEAAEHLPGVSEAIIGRHENAALISLIAIEALGVLSLGWLILYKRAKRLSRFLTMIVFVLALGATGLMAWTANLGGQIRHTEIRSNASVPTEHERESEDEGEHDRGQEDRRNR